MTDFTVCGGDDSAKMGRPRKVAQRKTVSFFLLPKLAEWLDHAYYQWNAGLFKEMRIGRAEFREMVLEKSLEHIKDNH